MRVVGVKVCEIGNLSRKINVYCAKSKRTEVEAIQFGRCSSCWALLVGPAL